MTNRLHELSQTFKLHQKMKNKLKNTVKMVKKCQEEQSQLSSWINNSLKALNNQMQEQATSMLDEVGKQV